MEVSYSRWWKNGSCESVILRVGRGEGDEKVCIDFERYDGLHSVSASRVASSVGQTADNQVAGPAEVGTGYKAGVCVK